MSETQERSAVQLRPTSSETMPYGSGDAGPTAVRMQGVELWLASIASVCQRFAPLALRMSLALVFVWFGALKVTGDSPVAGLIGQTLPFMSPDITVPALGIVEIAIGLVVAVGWARRVTLLVLAGHLTGTFLSFVTATELMFVGRNPLLLTADGEFVIKNLVLISAALVLIGREANVSRRLTPTSVTE